MTKISDELKPCPFCGGNSIYIDPDEIGSGGQWVAPIHVGCKDCRMDMAQHDYIDDAVGAWNLRAHNSDELSEIATMLDAGQGDDDGMQIMPDFEPGMSVAGKVELCLNLLEKRRDIMEAMKAKANNDKGACHELVVMAKAVVSSRSSTFKARNGRTMSIEDDSGEKMWIVPFDEMYELERALEALTNRTPDDE